MDPRRDRNWEAFLKLDDASFVGKYVVVAGGILIGAARDPRSLFREARRRFPKDVPLVTTVLDPRKSYAFSPRTLK